MKKNVAIGIDDYCELIEKQCFYIDKTGFIKEWWESNDKATLITRPRRFGKTLTIHMVECFFSIQYAGKKNLFEKFSIWENEEYHDLQGSYPVINLSFANVKEKDFQSARLKICQILTNLYSKFSFLADSDVLNQKDKEYFQRVHVSMNDADATLALYQLSDYLSRYYGKKVIILLDEYDTPMQEAYVNGYWDDLITFSRSMFNAAFKSNPYMERALLTGITRISTPKASLGKESVFSDLNNLKIVTTTSDEYASYFGFTEKEVFDAMDAFGYTDKELVKDWYDGFSFGRKKDIYNPWSILNYLDTGKVRAYWANTSSNRLVENLIKEGNKNVKQELECLLRGENIHLVLDEQIIYDQLSKKKNAMWSLLLASGYLKVCNAEINEESGQEYYELALTNKEVRIMFENMVRDWFTEVETEYNDFIKAFLENNEEAMNHYMNQLALEMFSCFDTGKRPSGREPERFYHGFVLGLLVELKDRYRITSNRESGFGRYDVMLEPIREEDDAYIWEFKVFDPKKEKDLEETVKSALTQIDKKQYETEFLSKKISADRIRKYGFAFKGKKVLISAAKIS